jgi:hypothetical protein
VRDATVPRRAKHDFFWFVPSLSRDEAAAFWRKPGAVSMFADPVYQLHNTRPQDFLR